MTQVPLAHNMPVQPAEEDSEALLSAVDQFVAQKLQAEPVITDQGVLHGMRRAATMEPSSPAFTETYTKLEAHFARWSAEPAPKFPYLHTLQPTELIEFFGALQQCAPAEHRIGNVSTTFIGAVNDAFLHYVESISAETRPEEIALLSTTLTNWGARWNTNVANNAIHSGVQAARANTNFGTLNSDEVVKLFVVSQKVAGPLNFQGNNTFEQAVSTKFEASYAEIDLQTHQWMIDSYPDLPPAAQVRVAEAANRPPVEQRALLEQVFRTLKGPADPKNRGAPATALEGFQAVVKYRQGIPGADLSMKGMFDWFVDALPVAGAAMQIAVFANSPGEFRDAWLTQAGDLGKFLNSATGAAAILEPRRWEQLTAIVSVSRFFTDHNTSWTPALQKHFEGLFLLPSRGPEELVCRFHLEVLKTHQELRSTKNLTVKRAQEMLQRLEMMDPDREILTAKMRESFKSELDQIASGDRSDRRDKLLGMFQPMVHTAQKELLQEGAKSYMRVN